MFIMYPIYTDRHHYHHESHEPKYKYKERLETSTYWKSAIFTFKLKDSVKPKTWWQKFWWVPKAEIMRLGTDFITKTEVEKIQSGELSATDFIAQKNYLRHIDGDYHFVSNLFDYAEDSMVDDVLANYDFVKMEDLGFNTDWVKVNPNEREVYE